VPYKSVIIIIIIIISIPGPGYKLQRQACTVFLGARHVPGSVRPFFIRPPRVRCTS